MSRSYALGRTTKAETWYGPLGTTLLPMVKEVITWDSFDRLREESFEYVGGTAAGGPSVRKTTSSYTFTGGEDFTSRRKVTYAAGFQVNLTPDGARKLQGVDLLMPGPGVPSNILARYRYAGNVTTR